MVCLRQVLWCGGSKIMMHPDAHAGLDFDQYPP
jgi:hypothetical protein